MGVQIVDATLVAVPKQATTITQSENDKVGPQMGKDIT